MTRHAPLLALFAMLVVVAACDAVPTEAEPPSEDERIVQTEGAAESSPPAREEAVAPNSRGVVPADGAAEIESDENVASEVHAAESLDEVIGERAESGDFKERVDAAMSGEGLDLKADRGASGVVHHAGEIRALGNLESSSSTEAQMGALGGTGRGGGGSSVDKMVRIQGMGKVETGSGAGKGTSGLLRATRTPVPRVQTGSARVSGKAAHGYAARGHRGSPGPTEPRNASEQYTDHGVNKFVDASEDAQSTFSIDVDTGSYTISRRKLQNGGMPPKAAVRVEEFVNYFDYSYRPPTNGDPFAVYLEAAPTPLAGTSERYLLRVGVQGKEITDSERKPVHLTFLVDVSGSMRSPDKIDLVKRSLTFLTQNLKPSDSVAIATYAGATRTVLGRTSVAQKSAIIDAIDTLDAGGSTAMNDGLKLAYELAMKDFDPDHENRVVVLSDGDANVGPRRHSEILDEISTYVKKGVTLSTVGFGMGNYRDTLMEQLANKGNGNYSYIDSISEAEKVFGKQLDGTLQVIAKDVKIQVEFNPAAVARYRLVGYENRDIADKDFRNDAVDAGEIGAGHTVTAIYELDLAVPASDLPDDIATVRVRNKTPRGSKAVERAFPLQKKNVQTTLQKASKDYQFAAAVAAFAEKLRESPYAEKISYGLIEEIAAAAVGNDSDRKEFVSLVQRASRL